MYLNEEVLFLLLRCLSYDYFDVAVAYPPAQQGASYVMAPPPVGYPLKDGAANPENQVPVQTQSRGDGFWKGW